MSYQVRAQSRGAEFLLITTSWIEEFLKAARLPSVGVQVANLIRLIGDHQSQTGSGYFVDGVTDTSLVGSFNKESFHQLLQEVRERGLVTVVSTETRPNPRGMGTITGSLFGLTLDGWERYEAERRGKVTGRYGFLAMKFDDPELEEFAKVTIKPGVKTALDYEVVDMRNVARAGIIDNILREQIRDAAFVLVDLTHDNAGAYWEAGYAEGLGKAVIYLCKRSKFKDASTHFDTNHSTTVQWEAGDGDQFLVELVATIRRSLTLF